MAAIRSQYQVRRFRQQHQMKSRCFMMIPFVVMSTIMQMDFVKHVVHIRRQTSRGNIMRFIMPVSFSGLQSSLMMIKTLIRRAI